MEHDGLKLRRLESLEDYTACVDLQRTTWGADFADTVPLSILKVAQRVGGVTAGAFDRQGALMGFVFGITGIQDGRVVHWSDMLAVRPEWRNRGLGRALKRYQRDLLLSTGVETVYWTYDPLEARNAHLNLNKLGARVVEYVENMYGETSSALHEGLGTDRFVVAWDLESDRVRRALADSPDIDPNAFRDAPSVNLRAREPAASGKTPEEWPNAAIVRVALPADIQTLKTCDPTAGAQWRGATRAAFVHYLPRGYGVTTIYRGDDDLAYYVLKRKPEREATTP